MTVNGLKGTVVNQTLPSLQGGSLEITLTVPTSFYASFLTIVLQFRKGKK